METNEPNLKPQPTGGLKLMTVFIAVLALHVLVIGGFSIRYMLYPSSVDNDLAQDKAHKGTKIVSDSTIGDLPASDTVAADKTAPAASDNSTEPSASTDTANASTASAATAAPATPTAPASVSTATTSATMPATPTVIAPQTPSAVSEDASSTAANPPSARTPTGPIHNGPVVTPPDNLAPPADATAASVTADASAPVADGTPYTVKRGDSLAKIARHHHVALAKLRTANSLASDSLHIGQKLVIPNRAQKVATTDASSAAAAPATTSTAATAPVSDTETATDAAAPATPSTESSVATIATPKHAHKPSAVHHFYTVVKGDTLTKIAKRYHTSTSAIMAANNISNASRLSIGQKLHIPSHESRAAATASQEPAPEEVVPRPVAKGQLANYTQ